MILKISYELRQAILGIPVKPKDDVSHLLPYVPSWLSEFAPENDVILIGKEEFQALPAELLPEIEVLHF
jgi:hypothetical protein